MKLVLTQRELEQPNVTIKGETVDNRLSGEAEIFLFRVALFIFFDALFVELDVVERIADQAILVCRIDRAHGVRQQLIVDSFACQNGGFSVGQPCDDLFSNRHTVAALHALIGPADVAIRQHPTAGTTEHKLFGKDHV